MPGRKPRHRGPHPGDREIFAPGQLEALATAASELSWLLSRGYNARSALKLVGDRHALTARQRKAVGRCACGEPQLRQRLSRQVGAQELAGAQVQIDGFNVIIVLESALSGGLVLVGRDGCCRDMASIHGSYRRVDETLAAVDLVGRTLAELGAASARILLDRPVSNSGRPPPGRAGTGRLSWSTTPTGTWRPAAAWWPAATAGCWTTAPAGST